MPFPRSCTWEYWCGPTVSSALSKHRPLSTPSYRLPAKFPLFDNIVSKLQGLLHTLPKKKKKKTYLQRRIHHGSFVTLRPHFARAAIMVNGER